MDELYRSDVLELPMDVAQRVEQMISGEESSEWIIFRSAYERRLWLVKRLFEDEEGLIYQVIASPIMFMSDLIESATS
jgi:hypothetical protein